MKCQTVKFVFTFKTINICILIGAILCLKICWCKYIPFRTEGNLVLVEDHSSPDSYRLEKNKILQFPGIYLQNFKYHTQLLFS